MFPTIYSTSDKTIRRALLEKLKMEYGYNSHIAVISEFSLSNTGTRADVAVINGTLHGYELKGDLDSLERLPRQIDGYNSVFDMITIVVGKKHLLQTVNEIPDWWGIVLAKDVIRDEVPLLIELRQPSQNIYQDLKTVVQLLWKNEIVDILKKEGLYIDLASFSKDELISELTAKLSFVAVKDYVREYLVSRNQS